MRRALKVGGKFYGVVQHPGTRPQAPLTSALAEESGHVIKVFTDVVRKGIEDFCAKRNARTPH